MPGGNLGPHVIAEISEPFAGSEWLDPEAGRVRTGAGTLGADLAAEAARLGFALPFLPSSGPWCRFGGMIANNAAGARSFRHGPIAHCVEAVEGYFAWGEPFRAESARAESARAESDRPPPPIFGKLEAELIGRHPESRDGTPPTGWPKVRKNSSGYPLDRYLHAGDPAQLLVGSEGTLGVVTAVELRLPLAPEATALAVVAVDSPGELTHLAAAARETPASACEFLGRRFIEMAGLDSDPLLGAAASDAYALVLLEVEGAADEVGDMLEEVAGLACRPDRTVASRDPDTVHRLWSTRHGASPTIAREAGKGRISTQFIEDSVVPPEALGHYLEELDGILAAVGFDAVVFGHAGDGNVHVNPLVDAGTPDWETRVRRALDDVTGLVAKLGGTLTGEHGDGRLRAPLLSRIWEPPLLESFRLVKDTLDPRGILNPGVILPLPDQDPLDGFTPRPRAYPR